MAEHYFDAMTLHKYVTPGETPDGIEEALNARKLILDTAETIRRDFLDVVKGGGRASATVGIDFIGALAFEAAPE